MTDKKTLMDMLDKAGIDYTTKGNHIVLYSKTPHFNGIDRLKPKL